MAKLIYKNESLKRVTLWVDSDSWERLASVVPDGNRSAAIRAYIERTNARKKDKREESK
jgi:hypothetical protein